MNTQSTHGLAGKRVFFVNWRDISNPDAGGAELHLHEVAKRLVSLDVECHLLCHRFKNSRKEECIDGLHIHRQGSALFFNFVVWFFIRLWEKKIKPDIWVDDSNKVPFFLPWLCRAPVVVRIHHLFDTAFFKETAFPMALYLFCLERLGYFAWKEVPVITVSASTQKELQKHGVSNITIAKNGVDAKKFHPIAKKRKFTLLSLGRIKRYKKYDTILYALKDLRSEFPELKLQIAGGGDDVHRLKKITQQLGLKDRVEFVGFVTGETKSRLFSEAGLFLITSQKEGYGLTVIEANASGTTCIATDVPGLRDSVKHNETGLLVPLGDAASFSNAIRNLLSDDVRRGKMESRALEWAKQHSWEFTAQITQHVLIETLYQKHKCRINGK